MKQVAVIVKDDVTELNKRLASGFQVSTYYRLENGDHMFIMVKYENRDRGAVAEVISPTSQSYTFTGTL